MDYFLKDLAARCATKAAELGETVASHPNSVVLHAEARAIAALGKTLTRLIGVKDAVEENCEGFTDLDETAVPSLPYKIVPGADAVEITKEQDIEQQVAAAEIVPPTAA
jgi:hypothetical protein